MTDLRGKRALVTGGATRLGREFSSALGTVGCSVAIHFNTNHRGAESTAEEIRSQGGEAKIFQADFRESESPLRLVADVKSAFGGLEILVNSASYWPEPAKRKSSTGFLRETTDEFDTALAVNCRAPFFLMQGFASELKNSNGNIINILDQSASIPYLSRASYSVSKSALVSASNLVAKTLGPEVRVNCLELGPVLPPDTMTAEEASAFQWAGPEAAVNGLLFLLLNQVANGQTLSIQGNTQLRKRT